MAETLTTYRQCNLCEAHCGIRVQTADGVVQRIDGDPEDVLSRGYICPKAAALADIAADPDRLRAPLRRTAQGFAEIGWDEALELAAEGLRGVRERHGADAVATYIGNPAAHSTGVLAAQLVRKLLGGRNHYSATSSDQLPQYLSSLEMFGHYAIFTVPDLGHSDFVLVLGANPAVSNGSLMTAPGVRDRLRAVRARGGRVVVVDPRRTETARLADEHLSVRPGGDAFLLLGMLHVVLEGGVDLGGLAGRVDGADELAELAARWPPERAAGPAGIPAETIARLARQFAAAPAAVAYGRVGICHQRTGALTHWLINALNLVTGNMDRPGGVMFPRPAIDVVAVLERLDGRARWGRYTQRVSGLPEFAGELPVAGLADELLEPGPGQVRGMLVLAGNPVLSTPGGARLDAAMAGLEFCVAVDMYVTETTRHADVILPPLAALERSDVDIVFPALSARNHMRHSPAALPAPAGGRTDWQILMGLAARLGGGTTGAVRNLVLGTLSALVRSPEPLIDLLIRTGPYGVLRDRRRRLSLRAVKRAPHGVDLGPLKPGLAGMLRTPDRRVKLAPPVFLAEAERLEEIAAEQAAAAADGYDLVLIGRRSVRSNNSWMHNSARLMKGGDRCTMLMCPADAADRGLAEGEPVRVASRIGAIEVPLEISEDMRPGVVSIPHGFGHGRDGVGWKVAAAHPGASVNDITDPAVVDRLTGNAALSATMVAVGPADGEADGRAGAGAGVFGVV